MKSKNNLQVKAKIDTGLNIPNLSSMNQSQIQCGLDLSGKKIPIQSQKEDKK
jgi:hypothetical protein